MANVKVQKKAALSEIDSNFGNSLEIQKCPTADKENNFIFTQSTDSSYCSPSECQSDDDSNYSPTHDDVSIFT